MYIHVLLRWQHQQSESDSSDDMCCIETIDEQIDKNDDDKRMNEPSLFFSKQNIGERVCRWKLLFFFFYFFFIFFFFCFN